MCRLSLHSVGLPTGGAAGDVGRGRGPELRAVVRQLLQAPLRLQPGDWLRYAQLLRTRHPPGGHTAARLPRPPDRAGSGLHPGFRLLGVVADVSSFCVLGSFLGSVLTKDVRPHVFLGNRPF